jgi:hypothetical protein
MVAAQGFGRRRPRKTTAEQVREVASTVVATHIDTINVLIRSHYLIPYSRLGPYRSSWIDELAYEQRTFFEAAAGSTAFVPVELFPLFRYRMEAAESIGAISPKGKRLDPRYVDAVYDEVDARGPLAASELTDPGKSPGNWWDWSSGKTALEHLWRSGRVAVSGRENFMRLYDVAERVIPPSALAAPSPGREDSQKELICLGARALGVATGMAVIDYLGVRHDRMPRAPDGRRPRPPWARLLRELIEEGRLQTVEVDTWSEPGYALTDVTIPRSVDARALLSPFDELVRKQSFGFEQHLGHQLYVPEARRMYGYYVLPFLLGDELVARCDLKADRDGRALLVVAAYIEPGQDARRVAPELALELDQLRTWLGLDLTLVGDRGDLAADLRKCVAARGDTSRMTQGNGRD